jgi:hypothetical protein
MTLLKDGNYLFHQKWHAMVFIFPMQRLIRLAVALEQEGDRGRGAGLRPRFEPAD